MSSIESFHVLKEATSETEHMTKHVEKACNHCNKWQRTEVNICEFPCGSSVSLEVEFSTIQARLLYPELLAVRKRCADQEPRCLIPVLCALYGLHQRIHQ